MLKLDHIQGGGLFDSNKTDHLVKCFEASGHPSSSHEGPTFTWEPEPMWKLFGNN